VIKKKGVKLNEIEVAQNIHWQDKHWKSLSLNYHKSPFFKDYSGFFKTFYSKEWKRLHDLNMDSMLFLMNELDLEVPYYFSSELLKDEHLTGTERLVEICKRLDAKTYLSGTSGRDYLEPRLFGENSIDLKFQVFNIKEYDQHFPPFIPNQSVVDLLFNMGQKAKDFI
jgi:hypothetical protein